MLHQLPPPHFTSTGHKFSPDNFHNDKLAKSLDKVQHRQFYENWILWKEFPCFRYL